MFLVLAPVGLLVLYCEVAPVILYLYLKYMYLKVKNLYLYFMMSRPACNISDVYQDGC